MLKRKIYNKLLAWKGKKDNKGCLLLKGARQVGKSFIVDYFAKENYQSYIKINFIETPKLKEIFNGELTSSEILKCISLSLADIKFIKGSTLIFLDEIQECKEARTALKFLANNDDFDVIASGSLLGISYKEVSSIPVGYETHLMMYPLDFEEFLWGVGYDKQAILNLKSFFDNKEIIPQVIHENMLKLIREYITVGGMPAVVNTYLASKNFSEVHNEQQKILDSYFDDISKYASTTEKPKVKNCYLAIPKELAKENKKFKFSTVEKKATARKYKNSIEWLRGSNLVNLCYNVSTLSFPLNAYEKLDMYKIYLNDIGLLIAMYGFEMKKAIVDDTLEGPIKGGIYENLLSCMLIQLGYKLYYFRNDNGSTEIEFLISKETKIIPIEVKAKKGRTLSLDKILSLNEIPYGYKFSANNIGIIDKKITMPVYMAMFLK